MTNTEKHMRLEFFIPRLPYAEYREFRDRLIRLAGGMTEGCALGHWVHPTQSVVTENVAHCMIIVPDTPIIRANIEAIATTYGIDAQQQEVLIIENGTIKHTIKTGV